MALSQRSVQSFSLSFSFSLLHATVEIFMIASGVFGSVFPYFFFLLFSFSFCLCCPPFHFVWLIFQLFPLFLFFCSSFHCHGLCNLGKRFHFLFSQLFFPLFLNFFPFFHCFFLFSPSPGFWKLGKRFLFLIPQISFHCFSFFFIHFTACPNFHFARQLEDG